MERIYSVVKNGAVVMETKDYNEASRKMEEIGGMVCYNLNEEKSTYAENLKKKASAKKVPSIKAQLTSRYNELVAKVLKDEPMTHEEEAELRMLINCRK